MTDENQNPYRQAREVENDALSRMTEPSPKEIGWDEGYAAGLHEAEAALEVAAQIMRDIPDAAITEGGWHNRAFGWLAAHDRRLAAATPDPPTDAHRPWPIAPDTVMPSRRQPVRWGSRADDPPTEIHDDPEKTKAYLAGLAAGRTEAPAASPDERLREAAGRLAKAVARVCGEGHPALAAWRVALAAATPDPPDALALLREEFGRNVAIMRRIENVLSPRDPRVPSGLPIGYGGPCAAATPTPSDDEGWSPGIDDPEPPALGDIDTGEGWYQT